MRPGPAAYESLVSEELRGNLRQAFDAATRATAQDSGAHTTDSAISAILAGEPRKALRLLECESGRLAELCTIWARWLELDWYPGNLVAENKVSTSRILERVTSTSTPDLAPIESLLAWGPIAIMGHRAMLRQLGAPPQASAANVLTDARNKLAMFVHKQPQHRAWAELAFADLCARAGLDEAFTSQSHSPVDLAHEHLIRADWLLTPGASPESLGFPASREPGDTAAAAACLAEAEKALDALPAPRARAALSLRRSVLAFRNQQGDEQRRHIRDAAAFAIQGGDAALCQLLKIHDLVAQTAAGLFAVVHQAIGFGWDLDPQGPVGEVVRWALTDGSPSFCTGMARMLEHIATAHFSQGRIPEARVSWVIAFGLAAAAPPEVRARIAISLADLEFHAGLSHGPLMSLRIEQALFLQPPAQLRGDRQSWLDHLNRPSSLCHVHVRAMASSSGASDLLECAVDRCSRQIDALLGEVGLPPEPQGGEYRQFVNSSPAQVLQRLKNLNLSNTVVSYQHEADKAFVIAVQSGRIARAMLRALMAEIRARRLERAGLDPSPELAIAIQYLKDVDPAFGYIIRNLQRLDRHAEARALYGERVQDPGVPAVHKAGAALVLRDYVQAARWFDDAGAPHSWLDHIDRARVALGLGRPDLAWIHVQAADRTFRERLSLIKRDADRVALLDDTRATQLALTAVQCCLTSRNSLDTAANRAWLERAFFFSERSRTSAATVVRTKEDRHLLEASWAHAVAVERLAAAIHRESPTTPGAFAGLERSERTLAGREQSATRAPQPEPQLADVQGKLQAGECVLKYLSLGDELVSWCITRDGIDVVEQRVSFLEGWIGEFARDCRTGVPSQVGDSLSQVLLHPFESVLGRSDRWIILPFRNLWALPFQALPFRGRPVAASKVISYLPGASWLLRGSLDRPVVPEANGVFVGDPAFDRDSYPSLHRLDGAALEARVCAESWRSQPILHENATAAALTQAIAGGCNLIHLAAHGNIDEDVPGLSSVLLADGELTMLDIAGLPLNTDLVVLSGCDTGRGALTMGGEVIGMARALLQAGVRRVIVSMWPVGDVAACITMTEFYRALTTLPPAAALRQAQQTVRCMDAAALLGAFRALGGIDEDCQRSRGRGVGRAIPLDPEFVEVEPDSIDLLDGERANVWAPFVLIG